MKNITNEELADIGNMIFGEYFTNDLQKLNSKFKNIKYLSKNIIFKRQIINVYFIEEKIRNTTIKELLKIFSVNQLKVIAYGMTSKLDISKYANPIFKSGKMEEIRRGLDYLIDVSKYADVKFSGLQMHKIRMSLGNGIDITKYIDESFSLKQIEKVYEQLLKDKSKLEEENKNGN